MNVTWLHCFNACSYDDDTHAAIYASFYGVAAESCFFIKHDASEITVYSINNAYDIVKKKSP